MQKLQVGRLLEIIRNETTTIYSDPILESLKFCFIFFRYIVVGLSSFLIDVGAFVLLYWIIHQKLSSLFIGRLVSGSFNFYFNKYLVYRSLDNGLFKREALRYVLLALVIFLFLINRFWD